MSDRFNALPEQSSHATPQPTRTHPAPFQHEISNTKRQRGYMLTQDSFKSLMLASLL